MTVSQQADRRADVIVIGGGIMGTTTAFFLRRRNPACSVILLERGLTGHGRIERISTGLQDSACTFCRFRFHG